MYSGYSQTLDCINSVIESLDKNKTKCHIIIINDASKDDDLISDLTKIVYRNNDIGNNITFLHNNNNLGFVKTVNRGMKLSQKDVILLNSDTKVASNWIDKLYFHAQRSSVATITPFSNNASICSYPLFCHENKLQLGETVESINGYFEKANHQQSLEMTTGIGFCLYITRKSLNKVGYFDESSFDKGYGEETDFCLRAAKLEFKHLIALDTYVFHHGSVSFGERAKQLSKQNSEIISKRYPDYDAKNVAFMLNDPARSYRYKVKALQIADAKTPIILQILHAHGGGTHKHAQDLANHFAGKANMLFLCPDSSGKGYIKLFLPQITKPNKDIEAQKSNKTADTEFSLYFERNNLAKLIDFLALLKLDRIHYHQVLGWEQAIVDLAKTLNVDYDVTLHDFYTVCPNIHLVGKNSRYCGEPYINKTNKSIDIESDSTDKKIQESKCLCQSQKINQYEWIAKWQSFLFTAKRVFVPSNNTKKHLQPYFPNLKITVATHPETIFTSKCKSEEPNKPDNQIFNMKSISGQENISDKKEINVLLIGALSSYKGADLFAEIIQLSKENKNLEEDKSKLNIHWHLIGLTYHQLKSTDNLTVHGRYDDSELLNLIHQIKPDIIWLPFLWPETHSYTLSAAMLSGYPIATTDIGAIPERLVGYHKYWLLDFNTNANDWLNWFAHYQDTPYNSVCSNTNIKSLNTENSWDYENYLVNTNRQLETKELDELSSNFLLYKQNCYSSTPKLFSTRYLQVKTLQVLIWLKTQYWLHKVTKLIPISTQVKLKNHLLGKKH